MKTTTDVVPVMLAVTAVLLTVSLGTAASRTSYEADYEVHLEKTQGTAGPEESIWFPIVVENHDDEPVRFTFEHEQTGGSASFHVTTPAPVELAAAGGEPTSARAMLMVHAPFQNGYVDEEAEIALTVQPHHAENASLEGEPETVTVTALAQGFEVPGPGPAAVLATVTVAAGLVRRGSQADRT